MSWIFFWELSRHSVSMYFPSAYFTYSWLGLNCSWILSSSSTCWPPHTFFGRIVAIQNFVSATSAATLSSYFALRFQIWACSQVSPELNNAFPSSLHISVRLWSSRLTIILTRSRLLTIIYFSSEKLWYGLGPWTDSNKNCSLLSVKLS